MEAARKGKGMMHRIEEDRGLKNLVMPNAKWDTRNRPKQNTTNFGITAKSRDCVWCVMLRITSSPCPRSHLPSLFISLSLSLSLSLTLSYSLTNQDRLNNSTQIILCIQQKKGGIFIFFKKKSWIFCLFLFLFKKKMFEGKNRVHLYAGGCG